MNNKLIHLTWLHKEESDSPRQRFPKTARRKRLPGRPRASQTFIANFFFFLVLLLFLRESLLVCCCLSAYCFISVAALRIDICLFSECPLAWVSFLCTGSQNRSKATGKGAEDRHLGNVFGGPVKVFGCTEKEKQFLVLTLPPLLCFSSPFCQLTTLGSFGWEKAWSGFFFWLAGFYCFSAQCLCSPF